MDLTPQARIRVAAVDLFGRQGFAATTVRQIAAAADVSPALVLHHYGSKDGLRQACDDAVIATLESKEGAFLVGPMPRLDDFAAAHPELAGVMDYLTAGLREGGELADRIYDRLLAMTTSMMKTAREQGATGDLDDPEGAHAVLVAMSCGVMMLQAQVSRRLGGDSLTDPDVVARYGRSALELFSGRLFAPAYADALRAAASPVTGDHP